MPPRYAYWTILVDDQPTAFRASAQEDLMPTFKRLQAKNPSVKMMWFQNGKLWNSRVDAQEAMHARGEMGRRGDARQSGGGFRVRERKPFRDRDNGGKRSAWSQRGEPSTPPPARDANNRLEWKPKGEFVPAPKRVDRAERPRSGDGERKPFRSGKPEWKPKGPKSFDRDRKPVRKPKGSFEREKKADWQPRGNVDRARKPRAESAKLEWKPKGTDSRSPLPAPRSPEKRKWVPKEEYKKSQGIEARRDKNWRPGGEHKDPRQKYKDAKRAKWGRFKQAIRTKWESKNKKKSE